MEDPPADLPHPAEQPLDAQKIVLRMLRRHGLQKAALAAADIHLQPRRAREDVVHLGPGKVIRRDKLHVHRRIFTAGFFFAKCCSHAAADTRPRHAPQDHSRSRKRPAGALSVGPRHGFCRQTLASARQKRSYPGSSATAFRLFRRIGTAEPAWHAPCNKRFCNGPPELIGESMKSKTTYK